MKKSFAFLCLFLAVFQIATAQVKAVSVDVTGKKLEKVLDEITTQSGVVFSYDRKIADTPISAKGRIEGALPKVLDQLFAGTGISWREISAERIALKFDKANATKKAAPVEKVKMGGRVVDNAGLPISGAAVFISGTSHGTITDLDGKWSMEVPSSGVKIEVSCMGYNSLFLEPQKNSSLELVLQDDNQYLDDVVVVGYGSQKKINMTGAVAQVNSTELKKAPAGNLSTMLAGKLPGLVSRQQSGQPGADGANLYVRGIGAGDGSMLVVVDGVIRSFPDLSPDEIESISILKDATSAAAYGVRASAGVMIITTKKGLKQKPTVSFNSSVALSKNTTFPEFLDGPEYAYWYNLA